MEMLDRRFWNIPYLQIENYECDTKLVRMIPPDIAFEHGVIVTHTHTSYNTVVVVAMTNPNIHTVKVLETLLNCHILFFLANKEEIENKLNYHYTEDNLNY